MLYLSLNCEKATGRNYEIKLKIEKNHIDDKGYFFKVAFLSIDKLHFFSRVDSI